MSALESPFEFPPLIQVFVVNEDGSVTVGDPQPAEDDDD